MAKKTGLGKGLGALMAEVQQESTQGSVTNVSVELIKPNPSQPREYFDETLLAELADSLSHHGLLQPLLVRPKDDGYEIIAGERRYQAALRAGLAEVPVIVKEVDESEAYRLALIENLQRTDLNPLEEARGYEHLLKKDGLTQTQIAQVVSKSRPYVANALRLLSLPESVQQLLEKELITQGHARAILAVPEEEGRERLAQRVVEENLTVRQTEHLAPLFAAGGQPQSKRTPTPDSYKRAARRLREALNAKVRVTQVRGRNKIEIDFIDEKDLERLLTSILQWEVHDE